MRAFLTDVRALMGKGANMASDAAKRGAEGIQKLANGPGLEAVCAACALMINADGKADQGEIQTAVDNMKSLPGFDKFDAAQLRMKIDEKLAKYGGGVAVAVAEAGLYAEAKKVPPEVAEVVVEICIQIATADGDFDEAEAAVCRKLIKTLELDEADFPRLQAQGSQSAGEIAGSGAGGKKGWGN